MNHSGTIDNGHPGHSFQWYRDDIERTIEFYCSCDCWKWRVKAGMTQAEAQKLLDDATKRFEDHVANPVAYEDAVIVSEQTIEREFSDVNEVTFLKVSTNGKVIYDTNPEESFWRDSFTGKRTDTTRDDGSFAERVLREEMFKYVTPTREYFSKYGNVPPFHKDMTQTTNVDLNIEVDGSRMIDRLRETVAEMQRKYPDMNRR